MFINVVKVEELVIFDSYLLSYTCFFYSSSCCYRKRKLLKKDVKVGVNINTHTHTYSDYRQV